MQYGESRSEPWAKYEWWINIFLSGSLNAQWIGLFQTTQNTGGNQHFYPKIW